MTILSPNGAYVRPRSLPKVLILSLLQKAPRLLQGLAHIGVGRLGALDSRGRRIGAMRHLLLEIARDEVQALGVPALNDGLTPHKA